MRYVTLSSGPFRKWPFFNPKDIEQAAVDDLQRHRLLPTIAGEVDIDSLVQALFGFTPTYTATGEGIMGFIRFGLNRPEKIIIEESLADLEAGPTTEHRRRSTLAHEIGHGRLHTGPFTELMQAKKAAHGNEWVRNPVHTTSIACRATDIREGESTQLSGQPSWERMAEWQANRYMAAVLTPLPLMRQAVGDLMAGPASHVALRLTAQMRVQLSPEISRLFNVSRQLADIRLAELFPALDGQGDLSAMG